MAEELKLPALRQGVSVEKSFGRVRQVHTYV